MQREHISAWSAVVLGCAITLVSGGAQADGLLERYIVSSDTGIEQTPVRIPEGVAFDPVLGDFYATGIFGGRITRIDGATGEEQTFFQDSPLLSFIGIKIAPLRRVAWVCTLDQSAGLEQPVSSVYAIGLRASGPGELLRKFELPTPFFCNDLALDLAGDAYVTNSVGSAIMKLDARGLWDMSVEAEVFVDSPLLAPPTPQPGGLALGMNGIAVTPDNQFVIVARNSPSQLLRISRREPSRIEAIITQGDGLAQVPNPAGGPPLQLGLDGIVFVQGKLYTVLGSAIQQLDFARSSRFGEATVSTRLDVPFGITTATNAYGRLYVIDSEIHAALPGAPLPIELPHSIVYVDTAAF